MKKQSFKNNEMYLPVTIEQWDALVNEMMGAFNVVAAPKNIEPNAMASILCSVIHHVPKEKGIVSKSALFEEVVNRVSCHVTNSIYESIEREAKASGSLPTASEALPDDSA